MSLVLLGNFVFFHLDNRITFVFLTKNMSICILTTEFHWFFKHKTLTSSCSCSMWDPQLAVGSTSREIKWSRTFFCCHRYAWFLVGTERCRCRWFGAASTKVSSSLALLGRLFVFTIGCIGPLRISVMERHGASQSCSLSSWTSALGTLCPTRGRFFLFPTVSPS